MRRQAVIGALVLVCVGVALGTTLLRSDIANATGLAPTVATTDGKPVKSKSSGPNSRSLTLEYFNGGDDEKFTSIKASALTIQGDTFGSTTWLYLLSDGQLVSYFYLQPSERVVLSLPKPIKIDEVNLANCFGSIQCFAQVNLIGS
jgi:hypothetical protein